MYQICRHVLQVNEKTSITLPTGSTFLSVEEQQGEVLMYFLEPQEQKETEHHEILCYGLAYTIPQDIKECLLLGVIRLNDNRKVIHVFKRTKSVNKKGTKKKRHKNTKSKTVS